MAMIEERTSSPLTIAGAFIVLALAGMVAWTSLKPPDNNGPSAYVDATVASRLGTMPAEPKNPVEPPAPGPPAADSSLSSGDPLDALIKQALGSPRAVPNEAVLLFGSKDLMARFIREAAKYGLRIVKTTNGINAVRIGFDDVSSLKNYLTAAGPNKPILDANHWLTVPPLPTEDKNNQGGSVPVGSHLFTEINATGDRSGWGKGITVAVLDTGVKNHPTFGADQVAHLDLVNDGKPFHSHGTSVASLIAGEDEQAPGVAPASKILDIRVANDKGFSVTSVLAQGIVEAVDRGATLINISMGGYDDSLVLRQAVEYARQKGVPIIAAAGNDAYDQLAYPAAIPGVISVGSVAGDGKQAYFSNSGSGLAVSAPGVDLTTAWSTNKIATVSGTSHSAAVTSGVASAALTLGISPSDLFAQMQNNARKTGAPKDKVGAGIVQVPKH